MLTLIATDNWEVETVASGPGIVHVLIVHRGRNVSAEIHSVSGEIEDDLRLANGVADLLNDAGIDERGMRQ